MRHIPMPGWVLLKLIPEVDRVDDSSLLVRPETAKEKSRRGVVIALPSDATTVSGGIREGDIANFAEYAGYEVFDWFGNSFEPELRCVFTGAPPYDRGDIQHIERLEPGDEDPFEFVRRNSAESLTFDDGEGLL